MYCFIIRFKFRGFKTFESSKRSLSTSFCASACTKYPFSISFMCNCDKTAFTFSSPFYIPCIGIFLSSNIFIWLGFTLHLLPALIKGLISMALSKNSYFLCKFKPFLNNHHLIWIIIVRPLYNRYSFENHRQIRDLKYGHQINWCLWSNEWPWHRLTRSSHRLLTSAHTLVVCYSDGSDVGVLTMPFSILIKKKGRELWILMHPLWFERQFPSNKFL